MGVPGDFLVRRDDVSKHRFEPAVPLERLELRDGEVALAIERFALTANNITYAVTGTSMSYFDFFPAGDGWGRVPAWGIASVARSTTPSFSEGERFFGFVPMSSYAVTCSLKKAPEIGGEF